MSAPDCTSFNPCTMATASDYARGYHDGMLSSGTMALAILGSIGLIWWLQWLTSRH